MAFNDDDVFHWLQGYAEQHLSLTLADDGVSLAELGLDSVESVSLVCALEDWLGTKIPSDFLVGVESVRDLQAKLLELLAQPAASGAAGPADYERFINPFLAAKLRQLKIERSFVKADGWHLHDADGEQYIDFMSQYGALPFGHHPARIWEALQSVRGDAEPNFAQPSFLPSAGRLARRLIELAPPGLAHVTFTNSGAEAVEAALKLARNATGRRGILSTWMGFHGKTFGALSATGKADYQSHFGLPLDGFDFIPFGDADALAARLAADPDGIAAFIVEPIQGEGGVTVPPPGYLRQAKEICARFGVLLIVDEVQTGLGRTGHLFACEADGVTPDILTLAKALGGGLVPVGACLCTAQVYTEKFALKHSSTFAGNALAARAGLATLDWLTEHGGWLVQQVRENGMRLLARLQALQQKYPALVREVCGRGYMVGLRFHALREPAQNFLGIAAQERELAQFVSSYLLNVERVRLAPTLNRGEVLRIQPPLNIPWPVCEQVLGALDRALAVANTRHTGLFYRALLERKPPPRLLEAPPSAPSAALEPGASEASRFAFVLHPLDAQSYADYDPSLRLLDGQELAEFAASMDGLLDPVVGSRVSITSATGARAVGEFILMPHTAQQLQAMSQGAAIDAVRRAVLLAKRRGAQLVGLGAYSSVVTGGGAHLDDCGVALTSGNSYTVAASMRALEEAVRRSGQPWSAVPAAVVGAAGAIGSCLASLLAVRAPRLILVGNPKHPPQQGRERLLAVARQMRRHVQQRHAAGERFSEGCVASEIARQLQAHAAMSDDESLHALEIQGRLVLTSQAASVGFAKVVVLATSFPGVVVGDAVFQRGTIVCDVSRPRSVERSILERRPDVLVIDGGVISVPGRPDIGPYGLGQGTAYACMAETMLLALDRCVVHTSLGASLSLDEVQRQAALAAVHGFDIAELQSFGRPLTEACWNRFARHGASGTRQAEELAT